MTQSTWMHLPLSQPQHTDKLKMRKCGRQCMRSGELLFLEVIWRVTLEVWAGLRVSVAQPWAWLRVWLCQAGREAEQCVPGCGCQGKGLQPPPLPQRLTSGTCFDLREEEDLKRKFSLCPSAGNGGVSFSHLDLTFWNHFHIFLISLSIPFPYLVALSSSFWFCILSSISRFLLLPSVFPYSSSSLVFVLSPKLFPPLHLGLWLLTEGCVWCSLHAGYC